MKIRGLGCVNRACARARFTQPSPHIFLHICIIGLGSSYYLLDLCGLAGVLLVGVCESVVVAVAGVGLVGGVHEATCRTSSEKREREEN